MASLKRLLVGSPIRTERLLHERLTKKRALAVFSSDALSSTAYATEEILLVLAAAYVFGQTGSFGRVIPISIGIAALLIIVATGYLQIIHAYPSGGGAYIVAKENLGTLAGLIAGASLLLMPQRRRLGVRLSNDGLLVALTLADLASFYLRQFAAIETAVFHAALLAGVIGYRNTLAAEAAWRDPDSAPAGTTPRPGSQPAPTPVTEGSRDLQG